jgi:hypothetical protein
MGLDDKIEQSVKTEIKLNENQLTEDKFDNDVIPTTKTWGIVGSILVGFGIFFRPNGGIIEGLTYSVIGIMTTLGLCVLLEGFSTVIKLLRKISEK